MKENGKDMIKVSCSICGNNMEMPESFLNKGIDPKKISHLCTDCMEKSNLDNVKMLSFTKEIKEQISRLGENNDIAEEIAEEITNSNIESLLKELKDVNAPIDQIIAESFFRGAWASLFLIANGREKGFLKKEAEKIKDFRKKTQEKMDK